MEDKELETDLKECIIITIGIIIICVVFAIIGCMRQQREIELEKYKIEMKYKNGDVVNEE